MNEEIPPPPAGPSNLNPAKPDDFQIPAVRVWFYAGPIILDSLALVCTTVLVALKILPVDAFKYLVGILIVGNMAGRMPGTKQGMPPGGGGFLVMIVSSVVATMKGFKS